MPRTTSQKHNKEPKLINLTVHWKKVLFGVPQGSFLGRIFFNIFLSDLFLTIKDVSIASYADDNTTYESGNNGDDGINSLQVLAEKVSRWFTVY